MLARIFRAFRRHFRPPSHIPFSTDNYPNQEYDNYSSNDKQIFQGDIWKGNISVPYHSQFHQPSLLHSIQPEKSPNKTSLTTDESSNQFNASIKDPFNIVALIELSSKSFQEVLQEISDQLEKLSRVQVLDCTKSVNLSLRNVLIRTDKHPEQMHQITLLFIRYLQKLYDLHRTKQSMQCNEKEDDGDLREVLEMAHNLFVKTAQFQEKLRDARDHLAALVYWHATGMGVEALLPIMTTLQSHYAPQELEDLLTKHNLKTIKNHSFFEGEFLTERMPEPTKSILKTSPETANDPNSLPEVAGIKSVGLQYFKAALQSLHDPSYTHLSLYERQLKLERDCLQSMAARLLSDQPGKKEEQNKLTSSTIIRYKQVGDGVKELVRTWHSHLQSHIAQLRRQKQDGKFEKSHADNVLEVVLELTACLSPATISTAIIELLLRMGTYDVELDGFKAAPHIHSLGRLLQHEVMARDVRRVAKQSPAIQRQLRLSAIASSRSSSDGNKDDPGSSGKTIVSVQDQTRLLRKLQMDRTALGYAHRALIQQAQLHQSSHIKDDSGDEPSPAPSNTTSLLAAKSWSREEVTQVGAVLWREAMRILRVQSTTHPSRESFHSSKFPLSVDECGKSRPLLSHLRVETTGGIVVGVLRMDSEVRDLLLSDPSHWSVVPWAMPMLMPPLPWHSLQTGGYLLSCQQDSISNKMTIGFVDEANSGNGDEADQPLTVWHKTHSPIRFKEAALQRTLHSLRHQNHQSSTSSKETGPSKLFLDGLNALGSTPWRVNQEILRVALTLWNDHHINVATFEPYQPHLSKGFDYSNRIDHHCTGGRERFGEESAKRGVQWIQLHYESRARRDAAADTYSSLCDVNYKLELARQVNKKTITYIFINNPSTRYKFLLIFKFLSVQIFLLTVSFIIVCGADVLLAAFGGFQRSSLPHPTSLEPHRE